MTTKRTAEEVVNEGWIFDATTWGEVAAAAQVASARSLRRIALSLERIDGKLKAVGRDGLHGLIRVLAKEAGRRNNLRLARTRGLRRKRKAAKLAAQRQAA